MHDRDTIIIQTSKVPLLTQSGDNLDQSPEMDEKAKLVISGALMAIMFKFFIVEHSS